MTEFLLLLSLWPFHQKKPVTPPVSGRAYGTTGGDTSGNGWLVKPECAVQDKLYFYAGDDKMIGISPASCEGAKDNWRKLHIDPVRMSRS